MTRDPSKAGLQEFFDRNQEEVERSRELSSLRDDLVRQRQENTVLRDSLRKELAAQNEYIAKREAELEQQEKELRSEYRERLNRIEAEKVEAISHSQAMMQTARDELRKVSANQERLKEQMEAFEDEKRRYNEDANKKLQAKSSEFVGGVVKDLRGREVGLMTKSTAWSVAGGVSLFLALAGAAYSIYITSSELGLGVETSSLIFMTIKGAIFVGVAGVLARYSFVLSGRYLDESLAVSDVIHGVSFGQLYVQSYGAAAGWDQVKDAFSRWHDRPRIVAKQATGSDNYEGMLENEAALGLLGNILDTVKSLKG